MGAIKILIVKGIIVISLILLTGCQQKLVTQAVKDATLAIEEQQYSQASILLHLASVESSKHEYEALHEQSLHLVNMEKYKEANNLDQMLLTWTELNLIDTRSDMIKEEATQLLGRLLEEVEIVAEESLEVDNSQEVISFIRLIETRMGTFDLFQSEIERLVELRIQLEGV